MNFPNTQWISGKWRDGRDSQSYKVINPATKEVLTEIAKANKEDVLEAIQAAHLALSDWKSSDVNFRIGILNKIASLIKERADDYANVLSLENGKSLAEAKAELNYGAGYFEVYAEEIVKQSPRIIEDSSSQKMKLSKEAVGVVGLITPWNFPQAMLARKLAAALVTGCTVVAKPDHQTPLSALLLGKICEDAGLPSGVVNIVIGEPDLVGKVIMDSPVVRKVSFTGSTRVGQILIEQSAKTVKRMSMELGGNAPFIVFESANLDKAVEGAMASKYRNSGQTCVCTNRFLVQKSILEEFKNKFSEKLSQLKIGAGQEEGVKIGPLINQAAIDKTSELLEDAKANGASVEYFGDLPELEGFFQKPSILLSSKTDLRIFKEEIFGPVSVIYPFESEEEAIRLANDTEFGLASYFYSEDKEQIHRVHDALEYGMIGINSGRVSSPKAPFGGIKHSGFGREGGEEGLADYQNLKLSVERFD